MNTSVTPLDFSAEARHKATIDVLAEALDYLERLPKVPLTTEFCNRIRAHLEQPGNFVDRSMHDTWEGLRVSPTGHTYATAKLRGNQLVVQSPAEVPLESLTQTQYERRLLNSLFKGLKFEMKNIGASLDEDKSS